MPSSTNTHKEILESYLNALLSIRLYSKVFVMIETESAKTYSISSRRWCYETAVYPLLLPVSFGLIFTNLQNLIVQTGLKFEEQPLSMFQCNFPH